MRKFYPDAPFLKMRRLKFSCQDKGWGGLAIAGRRSA
jgi:hypothetical protein